MLKVKYQIFSGNVTRLVAGRSHKQYQLEVVAFQRYLYKQERRYIRHGEGLLSNLLMKKLEIEMKKRDLKKG
jgi:hypothetical protein